jgi:3-oxoacyl-[acyl-carrier protein] reductase
VVTDVEREDDIVRLALSATREMGPVDILVNNAGHGYVAPVVEVDTDELDRVMRVNFRAAVLCTKHMVGGMVERRSGAVVNIASVSSKRGWAGGTPYVASKFALRGFAQCLWPEVRDAGVRVINLYPDYVATEFFDVMQIPRPGPEQILTPDGVAQLVMSALRLPPSANVVELEVAPTASG